MKNFITIGGKSSVKFILISLLVSLACTLILYKLSFISSYIIVLICWALLFCCCWLVSLLLIPTSMGKVIARRVTVFVLITAFSFTLIILRSIVGFEKVKTYIYDILGNSIGAFDPKSLVTLVVILIFGLVLFFINYVLQDRTVMKEHEDSFDKYFPEKDFNNRLKSFCNFLTIEINKFDMEANWSDAHFTPLEAEVEIYSSRGRTKKIANLLKAIRKDNRSKVFLILGDPGSGKSVALRKLCRDLIGEVVKTKKIPIYLNLKEWQTDQAWSEEKPPTINDFYEFCLSFLKGKDIFADEFVDRYFKRLYENGHLFFIIDSFDEIPAVLDVDESSWLIDKLSEILFAFLGGAHDSRGILSSRYYRKPSSKFNATTILNIRPFSDYRIYEALNKYVALEKGLINSIFKERVELLPIASNPFTIGLIYSYLKDNYNLMPATQAELYASYINSRLETCKERYIQLGLTKDEIIEVTIEVAAYMFDSSNKGLEIPMSELQQKFRQISIQEIIDILIYARIGRLGQGSIKRFSFVHRRFNEYFLVQKYLDNPNLITIDAIPNDTKYRDSLVLYCEIAPIQHAKKIAEFCWGEVKLLNEGSIYQIKRSTQCLRFLVGAFGNRVLALEAFRSDLGDLIKSIINNYRKFNHPLIPKIAIEGLGLIPAMQLEDVLLKCFEINNWFVNQAAIKACRQMDLTNKSLKKAITKRIISQNYLVILRQSKELRFSLSLSNSLKNIRSILYFRVLDIRLSAVVLIVLTVLFPLLMSNVFLGALIPVLIFLILSFKDSLSVDLVKMFRYMVALLLVILLFFNSVFNQSNNFFFIATVLLVMCVVPLVDIIVVMLNVKLKKNDLFFFLRFLNERKIIIICFIIYFAFIDNLNPILSKVTVFIMTFFGVSAFFYSLLKDFFNFKKKSRSISNQRNEIAEQIMSFHSDYFKWRFVLYLQKEITECGGEWPKKFDMNDGSRHMTLLAQLDEKWLGLS